MKVKDFCVMIFGFENFQLNYMHQIIISKIYLKYKVFPLKFWANNYLQNKRDLKFEILKIISLAESVIFYDTTVRVTLCWANILHLPNSILGLPVVKVCLFSKNLQCMFLKGLFLVECPI